MAKIFPDSCVTRAMASLYGNPYEVSLASSKVNGLLGELQRVIASDQRIRAATRAWSECMAGRGHAFDDPGQIVQFLTARLENVTEPGQPRQIVNAEESATAELRQLQDLELRLAAVDRACRRAVDLNRVIRGVRRQWESLFVARYGELIEVAWGLPRSSAGTGSSRPMGP